MWSRLKHRNPTTSNCLLLKKTLEIAEGEILLRAIEHRDIEPLLRESGAQVQKPKIRGNNEIVAFADWKDEKNTRSHG